MIVLLQRGDYHAALYHFAHYPDLPEAWREMEPVTYGPFGFGAHGRISFAASRSGILRPSGATNSGALSVA